jgi:hypothetical protein
MEDDFDIRLAGPYEAQTGARRKFKEVGGRQQRVETVKTRIEEAERIAEDYLPNSAQNRKKIEKMRSPLEEKVKKSQG